MFHSLRPGVYTRYELTAESAPGKSAAALVLRRDDRTPGCHELFRLADAADLVGGDTLAEHCLSLLFEGEAGKIYLVFYTNGEEALSALPAQAGVVICDETVPKSAILSHLEGCAAARCDCLFLTGRDDPQEAATAARSFSHERILLCGPDTSLPDGSASSLFGACCLAGAILCASGPMERFSGRCFPALVGARTLTEEDIQMLLRAGVCVFEETGGEVSLIRAFTTAEDSLLRSLNTLLAADHVVARIRGCLSGRLRAGVTGPASIRDQVSVELMALAEEGVLTGFDPPVCYAKKDDPSCCVVELSFSVAHLVSRIHITAHIRA